MSATVQSPRLASTNRRRSVRQKVHVPAYATFSGDSKKDLLDLYEVLDISEGGVAVQCASPLEVDKQIEIGLDLAESSEQFTAKARVVWSNANGRAGLGFSSLAEPVQRSLREWLFLNSMAGAANAASSMAAWPVITAQVRPNYTDTLSAASAVQREAESLGNDLEAVLSLIALRSNSLFRASGAAIALAEENPNTMTCRASAGESAPPVGVVFQAGSGFSGECVRSGKSLRCDDAEIDERVDAQSCRVLGIRSILAVPVRSRERVIGLLEIFSSRPDAFNESVSSTLQRFAETISAAVERTRGVESSDASKLLARPFVSTPGSILFAQEPEDAKREGSSADEDRLGGVHLPRAQLYVLYCVAATIALVLGFMLAPWIQEKLQAGNRSSAQTVLASSPAPNESAQAASRLAAVDSSNLEQLQEMARHGNPAAENALGLLYAQGDDKQLIKQDENQAARWFTKAAEDGSVPAQYKLSLLYWGGHGVPKDTNKAYFWAVLARAGGQDGSKDLAKVLSNGMTRSQTAAIEQQAEIWYQQHESRDKPKPGR